MSHDHHMVVTWPSHGCHMTITGLSHDHHYNHYICSCHMTITKLSHDHQYNHHMVVTWPSHDREVTNQRLTWGGSSVDPSLVHTWLPLPVPFLLVGLAAGSWNHWGQRSHQLKCLSKQCWASCHQGKGLEERCESYCDMHARAQLVCHLTTMVIPNQRCSLRKRLPPPV